MFYLDNVLGWSATGLLYPVIILCFISFDMIVMYFPRRPALAMMVLIVMLNLWNIFNHTFLKTNCKQYMLPWGIFGENISYCTIKRLIYQTILSLMVSAAITLLSGHTDNLFFCNVNIYRSTGTIDRHTQNASYVSSMRRERDRSTDAENILTGTIDRRKVNEKDVENMKSQRARSIDADKSDNELEMT